MERLLEDESLTADLVDPAARRLLEWGVAHVDADLQDPSLSTEEVQARLSALRRRMRAIARRIGERAPEEQPDALRELLESGNATSAHEHLDVHNS